MFELEFGNQNVHRQTDGQTNIGHINLIGGLVTHNPSKKKKKLELKTTYSVKKIIKK